MLIYFESLNILPDKNLYKLENLLMEQTLD